MGSIIVAMPKIDDAKKISAILQRRGLESSAICTTAANVLTKVHSLDSGIVICGRSLPDMYCNKLLEYLPEYFELLILTSYEGLEHCPPGVMTLTMPLKTMDFINTVEMMLYQLERKIKKQKSKPKKRSAEEQKEIDRAKKMLMERNHMTEQEAFRYIQKCSMDSGTNMAETAQMIWILNNGG